MAGDGRHRLATRWGEITLVYRHLEWNFESGDTLNDIDFSGPALLFKFNFFWQDWIQSDGSTWI